MRAILLALALAGLADAAWSVARPRGRARFWGRWVEATAARPAASSLVAVAEVGASAALLLAARRPR